MFFILFFTMGASKSSVSKPKKMNKFKPQAVISNIDTRVEVFRHKTLQFIGLLRMKRKDRVATGTGFIVSSNLVLTAAHNIVSIQSKPFRFRQTCIDIQATNPDEISFPQWIQFYPGFNGSTSIQIQDVDKPFDQSQLCYKVSKYRFPNPYVYKQNRYSSAYDYCLLEIDMEGKKQFTNTVSILPNFSDYHAEIMVCGYPGQRQYIIQKNKITWNQYKAKGKIKQIIDDEKESIIEHLVDTSSGQSGSPILVRVNKNQQKYFCIGIHISGNSNDRKNIAIYFNTDVVRQIAKFEQDYTKKPSKLESVLIQNSFLEPCGFLQAEKNVHNMTLQDLKQKISKLLKRQSQQNQKFIISKGQIYYYYDAGKLAYNLFNFKQSICYYEQFIIYEQKYRLQIMEKDQILDFFTIILTLIGLYNNLKNTQQGLKLVDKYYNDFKNCFGKQSLYLAQLLNNKALLMMNQKQSPQNIKQIQQLLQRSYDIKCKVKGKQNKYSISSLQNINSFKLMYKTNKKDDILKIIKSYQQILQQKFKIFKKGSKQQVTTKMNLAIAYFCLQQKEYIQKFIDYFKYCFDTNKKIISFRTSDQVDLFQIKIKQNFSKYCFLMIQKQLSNLQQTKKCMNLAQSYGLIQIKDKLSQYWINLKNKMIKAS